MNDSKFKKEYKMPACASAPWANLIPASERAEVIRIINEETIEAIGYDLSSCPKRFTCFGKHCIGRPLPYCSKTALPYLEKLEKTQNIVNEELFISTDCNSCPIFKTCNTPCNQVLDFIERDKKSEPKLTYSIINDKVMTEAVSLEPANFVVDASDIPWDVLTSDKAELIRKYFFEGLNYAHVASLTNLSNKSFAKYKMYWAINKLTKFAVIRKFIKNNSNKFTSRQLEVFDLVYIKNYTMKRTAEHLGISRQAVQNIINTTLKNNNVKWPVFIKRKGNKIIYNIPKVLR